MKTKNIPEWEDHYLNYVRNMKTREKRINMFSFKGKILDLGCGDGLDLMIFNKEGHDVTGIDNSNNLIQICKKRGLNARLGSAYEIPFKNKTFDIVFVNSVFHHIAFKTAFWEIRRVLKANGKICFLEPKDSILRRIIDEITVSELGKYIPVLNKRRTPLKLEWKEMYRWLDFQKDLKSYLVNSGFKVNIWKTDFLTLIVEVEK